MKRAGPRWLRFILVLVALFITACAGDDDFMSAKSPSKRTQEPSPSGRTQKPDSWRVIADGPIKSDYGHRGVWTGKEVIIWGGTRFRGGLLRSRYVRTGGAYDPKTDSWRKVPAAPMQGGFGYSAIWTGDEMILWGDSRDGRRTRGNFGAAYDPATNEWRRIASGPLTGRAGHLAVWTGDEMIVWGGYLTAYERERYDGAGAAYDPETDSWRQLPRGPLPAGYDAMGAWTGEEVLVMSTPMGIDEEDYPKFDELAAYSPASDSWRSLARPPHVSSVGPPIAFVDGKLAVLSLLGTVDGGEVDNYGGDYETGGIYDYSIDRWMPHADPPRRPNHTWEQTAMGDEIVIDALAYRPSTSTWRTLPEFPLREREFPVLVWTGNELIVWGGAARVAGDPPPPLHDGAAYTPP